MSCLYFVSRRCLNSFSALQCKYTCCVIAIMFRAVYVCEWVYVCMLYVFSLPDHAVKTSHSRSLCRCYNEIRPKKTAAAAAAVARHSKREWKGIERKKVTRIYNNRATQKIKWISIKFIIRNKKFIHIVLIAMDFLSLALSLSLLVLLLTLSHFIGLRVFRRMAAS